MSEFLYYQQPGQGVEVLVFKKDFHISDKEPGYKLSTIPKFLMVLVTNLCN